MTPAELTLAACRNHTHLFFPADTDSRPKAKTEQWRSEFADALRLCEGCPVTTPCLEEAVATRDWQGVRGGLTPPEIRVLRNQLTSRHGTRNRYRAGCHCDDCNAANNRYRARAS